MDAASGVGRLEDLKLYAMRNLILAAFFATQLLSTSESKAQNFLKKLKQTAEQVIDKKPASSPTPTPTNTDNVNGSEAANRGRAVNKGGGGLTSSTAPDVAQQIVDAEQAYTAAKFSEARFAVQQALLGVELQLGKQILKSLPLTVSGLPGDTTQDKVVSTSWGWSNLTIGRTYSKGDKEFTVNIGNNPIHAGFANAYFSGMYSQSVSDKQNVKQVKVKGHKAVVKYDDNEGYTLLIPLGQSAMIAFNGINFSSEQEVMTAVNAFDIDGIKKLLGEQ